MEVTRAAARALRATAKGTIPIVLATLAVSTARPPSARAGWEGNQCVTCHEAERLPISLGHSFEEWRASEHARAGVGCEKCHGGDPAAKEIEAAHKGVLPASDPASLVHPKRIAAMCGTCHPKELGAYAETVHARQVQKTGKGATCFTCHGSMATSLPSPSELSARCATCHKHPVEARAALALLAATKIQLRKAGRTLDAAKTADPAWHAEATKRFQSMERDYAAVQLKWHTFAMEATAHETRDLLKLIDLLNDEAKVHIHRGR